MVFLNDYYDFKFDQLAVRYRSLRDTYFYKFDSESFINLGMPGAIILLGKNGAGKSRFLNGLKSFGERQMTVTPDSYSISNPVISLRYSVPTVEEHLEYLEAKKNILLNDKSFQDVDDYFDLQRLREQKLNLYFHDLVIRSFATKALNSSFRDTFGFESVEVLKFFEFPEKEIKAFETRLSDHFFEFGPFNPGQHEMEKPRENLNFRDYFAEFFLALMSTSNINQVDYEVGFGSCFNCTDYLADKSERVRLVSALREVLEKTTHIELFCDKGEVKFTLISLIDEGDQGDDLKEVLNKFGELREQYDSETFPFDLLSNEASLSTLPMKLEFEFRPYEWRPFDILDLTFQKQKESIDQLKELFTSFLNLEIAHEDLSDYQVKVSVSTNLDKLIQQVNTLLPDIDIGISKIERKNPSYHFNPDGKQILISKNYLGSKSNYDFTPIIGWHDSNSKKLLPLEICSDGQLDVLRILINLCNFTSSASTAGVKFLLIDEFDRHLHPVIAQQLLDLLDRFAKKFETYVLVSTHTISSLTIHKHAQLFASRDIYGFHHLSIYRHDDPKVASIQLGIPERDVRKFMKLFVVVEGDHEEIIFNELFSSNSSQLDFEIINLNGLQGLANIWRSLLQHESADVLVVYDKKNQQFEEVWLNLQRDRSKAQFAENLFESSGIKKIQAEAYNRIKSNKRLPGDTELNALGFLLKEVLDKNDNQIRNIKRLHLHGMGVPDIVECLPISEFPKARSFKSWEILRQQNEHLKPSEFKIKFGIDNKSVEKAVKGKLSQDLIHPELQSLWSRILGILEISPEWMQN